MVKTCQRTGKNVNESCPLLPQQASLLQDWGAYDEVCNTGRPASGYPRRIGSTSRRTERSYACIAGNRVGGVRGSRCRLCPGSNQGVGAGIRNLARLQTTVACAGAITPEAVADIRKMGFVSIVNLRLASEPEAQVDKEEAAAKTAGLKFSHPVQRRPDPKAASAFLMRSPRRALSRRSFIAPVEIARRRCG